MILFLAALAHAEPPRCDLYDRTPSAKVTPALSAEDAAAFDRTCWMLVWTHGPGSPDLPDLASALPMLLSGASRRGLLTGECATAAEAVTGASPDMLGNLLAHGCPALRQAHGADPTSEQLQDWVIGLWRPTVERARALLHPIDREILDGFWR